MVLILLRIPSPSGMGVSKKVVNNHAEVITSLRKNADITNENIQTINKVGESLPEVYKSVAEIYEMTKSKSKPLTFWQWLGF